MTDLPLDPDARPDDGDVLLTVRPRRIAVYASIGAAAVILVGVFVALKLRSSDTGVIFRTSDALAMAGLGLLFAGGLLLTARPRLRADAAGLRVRNIVGERFVAWPVIERIAFPEGAVWAQLELADDEVVSVMAIQAMDKERAVVALREVRALHDRFAPPQTRRQRPPAPAGDPNRPLGRLEIIDRQKAAEGGAEAPPPLTAAAQLTGPPDRSAAVGAGSRPGPAPARPAPASTRETRPAARGGRPGRRRRAARGPATMR